MTEPIRIPLSVHQQARFAAMRTEARALTDHAKALKARESEAVTTIVAQDHDPEALATWALALGETEIVCTPPADP